MPKDGRFRIRLGIQEWPWMTRGDKVFFHIMTRENNGDLTVPVDYIEADTIEEARTKCHARVDHLFNHKLRMKKIDEMVKEKQDRLEEEIRFLKETPALTIGNPVLPTKENG